jgi:beta-phosphoglucomutase-like phosphatase (HAD superfamily)
MSDDDRTNAGRRRPVTTVLDMLRVEIDIDSFDVALCGLESVAVDLGYGDVRPLPGSVAWLRKMHESDKRLGLLGTSARTAAALELAGIEDLFDNVTIGARTGATLHQALEEMEVEPERAMVVTATASGVAAAREAKIPIVVAAARGLSSPEELRQAGASTVVADLQELIRAVT